MGEFPPPGGAPGGMQPGSMAAGFGGGKGPGSSGGTGGKSSNPDDIEARKKKSLDRTSADFRAKSDRFRKEMDQRMKERGITPPSGGQGGRR